MIQISARPARPTIAASPPTTAAIMPTSFQVRSCVAFLNIAKPNENAIRPTLIAKNASDPFKKSPTPLDISLNVPRRITITPAVINAPSNAAGPITAIPVRSMAVSNNVPVAANI